MREDDQDLLLRKSLLCSHIYSQTSRCAAVRQSRDAVSDDID